MSRETENDDAKLFYLELTIAVNFNDLQKFKDLIASSKFPKLPLEKKLKHAFHKAYYSGKEDMLNYLIYDYCISSADAIDAISSLMYNQELSKKFEIRDLARALPINPIKKKITKV